MQLQSKGVTLSSIFSQNKLQWVQTQILLYLVLHTHSKGVKWNATVLSLQEDSFLIKKFTEAGLNPIIQDSLSSLDLLSTGDMQGWSLWPVQLNRHLPRGSWVFVRTFKVNSYEWSEDITSELTHFSNGIISRLEGSNKLSFKIAFFPFCLETSISHSSRQQTLKLNRN